MKIFGYTIERNDKKEDLKSPIAPESEESSIDITQYGGIPNPYSHTIDFDKKILGNMTENRLIEKYRDISYIPIVDRAIEEIISDMIILDGGETPISVNTDDVPLSDNIKKEITLAFEHSLNLLHFTKKGYDIARKFYVDGRLNYAHVIDMNNTKKGIQELRYVDPKKIKKVRQFRANAPAENLLISRNDIQTYYLYSPTGIENNALGNNRVFKIPEDTITSVSSGLVDSASGSTLSWLHKALRAANILRMTEDSAVIYRLNNSAERRIFYIEVGELSGSKAQSYLESIATKYKNKQTYDVDTGQLRDDRRHLAITEDFWIPRRSGQDGTQIDTLQAGQNLGQMEDIEYFKQNLYDALNVPKSRFADDTMISRGTEISRDEMKFAQFITRLRTSFNSLFLDIMKKHLALKGVMRIEDWEKLEDYIKFEYKRNNYFSEALENQVLQERMAVLRDIKDYEGSLFSRKYILRNVLRLTDEEIDEMQKEIDEESKAGLYGNEEDKEF